MLKQPKFGQKCKQNNNGACLTFDILKVDSIVRKLGRAKHLAKEYVRLYRSKDMATKLTENHIRYISQQLCKGASTATIAKHVGVTQRHIQRLAVRLQESKGDIQSLLPRKAGRKARGIDTQEQASVLCAYRKQPQGVLRIKKWLDEKGYDISYYTVYSIMKQNGLIKESKAKSRKRKWVRYERKHSNAMWHVDWHQIRSTPKRLSFGGISRRCFPVHNRMGSI